MDDVTLKEFEMRPGESFAAYNARTSALLAKAIGAMKRRVLAGASSHG